MWAWVAMGGWCANCHEPNLTVQDLVIVKDGHRVTAWCKRCGSEIPSLRRQLEGSGGDDGMAKAGKKDKGTVRTRYADRYPGGVPLHGSSDMFQWDKVGKELVGEFVACKPYKKGHIGNVITDDGMVAFSAPTVLANILEGVKRGSKIAMVFASEDPPVSKGRSGVKRFEVYALDGANAGPVREDDEEEGEGEEEGEED